MKLKLEFVKREIAGENFLVPVGKAAKTYSGLFALNELAAFIWDRLPEAEDEEAIVSAILDEYDVSYDDAKADTEEFLAKLREMEII